MRQITIADDTDTQIQLNIWGELAKLNQNVQDQGKLEVGGLIVIRKCRVSTRKGFSLNASSDA